MTSQRGRDNWNPSTEIVFTRDAPAATLSARLARGELRRIRSGVYTTNLTEPLERITRRNRFAIVARLVPGAVITDRSALPDVQVSDHLFVCHPGAARDIQLPGLLVRVRNGHSAFPNDSKLGQYDLSQASIQRALVENTLPSRARGGRQRRTAAVAEIEDVLTAIAQREGIERIRRLRVEVIAVGHQLENEQGAERIVHVIDALLGDDPRYRPASRALAAHLKGAPYDADAVRRFDLLVNELIRLPPDQGAVAPLGELPFFEAYFSNYIEGTEFELEDARRIVTQGWEPAERPEDAHDVRCTYTIVSDDDEMIRVASTADDFLQLLRERHRVLLASRPDMYPGRFKNRNNRAGGTEFVSHELVEGTLREGFRRVQALDDPFQRAVCVMFVVAETHPFDDGNGRIARVFMNAELMRAGHQRIVIPPVYRDDHLGALRALSRSDNPTPVHRMMAFAQEFCRRIDWSDYEAARRTLEANNAFLTSDAAEDAGRRLTLP